MVGRIESNVSISIENETTSGTLKYYVTCKTDDLKTATDIQSLFNKQIGAIEVFNPVVDESKFKIRFRCQLHRIEDIGAGAANADRGNTVVDGFIRVVHVASKVMPRATVNTREVWNAIKQHEYAIIDDGDDYPLRKLKTLKECLPNQEKESSAVEIDTLLLINIRKFLLSVTEREKKNAKNESVPVLVSGAYVPITVALRQDDKTLKSILQKDNLGVSLMGGGLPEVPKFDVEPTQTPERGVAAEVSKVESPVSAGKSSKKARQVELWAWIVFPVGIIWFILNKILDYRDKNKV